MVLSEINLKGSLGNNLIWFLGDIFHLAVWTLHSGLETYHIRWSSFNKDEIQDDLKEAVPFFYSIEREAPENPLFHPWKHLGDK